MIFKIKIQFEHHSNNGLSLEIIFDVRQNQRFVDFACIAEKTLTLRMIRRSMGRRPSSTNLRPTYKINYSFLTLKPWIDLVDGSGTFGLNFHPVRFWFELSPGQILV